MNATPQRLRLIIRGAVQGVGFRPFVHHLAAEIRLAGWVRNSPQGVSIEVEGPRASVENFLVRLESEKPPRSFIQSLEPFWLDPTGCAGFQILPSETSGGKTALIQPDIATCPDCLREIFDPANRRHRYPFTNCTHCGPRFSIIESLPYDRANTTMASFVMCPQCQAEYENPDDRRFHAQPNACPTCGPRLELWSSTGLAIARHHQALLDTAAAIRRGQIAAVKGVGGFHLLADARNEDTLHRLRDRKRREEKPFALMFPNLARVKAVCEVSALEERLLRSPEAPIVLLRRRWFAAPEIAASVAPGNPRLGIMLPSNPLHHLLMAELDFPVVATSGNLSEEPLCIDELEALHRLGGIADLFLMHNRPIRRHVDDSIVRVDLDRELVLRRARGYAPLPVSLPASLRHPAGVLAVGGHLKNTVALAVDGQAFLSQHIGDLETEQTHAAFQHVIADFEKLFEIWPAMVVSDLHPDYLSTHFAAKHEADLNAHHVGAQHHIAHILSAMAENELDPPALGVSWDGTGYGLDGTVWGGEFFDVTKERIERVAHLRPFRLPGGDLAARQPRRAAAGLLYELYGEEVFDWKELAPMAAFAFHERRLLRSMLERHINSPLTSSMGRLFDAVASLLGLRQQTHFEGQAAMELEFAAESFETTQAYSLPIFGHSPAQFDWEPMIREILRDQQRGMAVAEISARFHNTLAYGIVSLARRAEQERVVLSGGCFQNRYLIERTVRLLQTAGFKPYWHQRVPPNDGGLALGQVVAALREL